jgi:hypothetical protein
MLSKLTRNKFHFIFIGLWVVISFLLFIFYGDEFILNSKLGWEWGMYVVLWISLPILYLGLFVFRWRKWIYGIYLIAAVLLIPLIVHVHDAYLHNSEEKAIREFISAANNEGVLPRKFSVNDSEELKCLSNYATSTYILNGSKFLGSVWWMVEFDNGQTFHIYTTRQDLSHWEVELHCFDQVDS